MKVSHIDTITNRLYFDNGYSLMYYHNKSGNEQNFADWKYAYQFMKKDNFDEDIPVEIVEHYGIRIQSKTFAWYSIPCYSIQDNKNEDNQSLDIILLDNNNYMLRVYSIQNCSCPTDDCHLDDDTIEDDEDNE